MGDGAGSSKAGVRIQRCGGEAGMSGCREGVPQHALRPCQEIGDRFVSKDRQQVQVNMLGCIAWGNAAARRFLARKAGCFVGVSSVAGDRGRVGRPVYNASKAGMDCYLEALRNRLWRHGVQVTTIRPGFVETPMTAGLKLKGAIPADKAAELILRARDRRKAVAYVPGKWRLIMTVIKLIPSFLFRRLSI
jgi:NAD(P)-dependent dehydrogenase (short-subunit alcohol dehydrogenase family)